MLQKWHHILIISTICVSQEKSSNGTRKKPPPALSRSASYNWASLRRASQRAVAMKEEYDKVQTEKRTRSPSVNTKHMEQFASIPEEEGIRLLSEDLDSFHSNNQNVSVL